MDLGDAGGGLSRLYSMLVDSLLYSGGSGSVSRDEELVPDLDLLLSPGVELIDTLHGGIVLSGDAIDSLLTLYLVLTHPSGSLCEALYGEDEQES